MALPVENLIAAYPPSVQVGGVTLNPLTIGGAILLDAVGVDVTKTPVPKGKLFEAAYVLSEAAGRSGNAPYRAGIAAGGGLLVPRTDRAARDPYRAFGTAGGGHAGRTVGGVPRTPRTVWGDQYRAFLRGVKCGLTELSSAVEEVISQAFSTRIVPRQEGGVVSFTPSGHGWPLELAESLCAEYGWGFEEALATPLCRAFALQAVARIRNGGRHGGPDYVERTLDIVKNGGNGVAFGERTTSTLTGERRRRYTMDREGR